MNSKNENNNIAYKAIGKLIDIIHLSFVFSPLLLFILPSKYLKPYMKWILLVAILTPLHWKFFDNRCFLTVLSKKLGFYEDSETDSEFSENNLKWLYEPIMKLIGWEWNDKGLDKMVNLHWIINILLIWGYTFFPEMFSI